MIKFPTIAVLGFSEFPVDLHLFCIACVELRWQRQEPAERIASKNMLPILFESVIEWIWIHSKVFFRQFMLFLYHSGPVKQIIPDEVVHAGAERQEINEDCDYKADDHGPLDANIQFHRQLSVVVPQLQVFNDDPEARDV